MATNTVASMAIKLGIDASQIPAQLRNVSVNLTTEQRRMARDQKALEAEMIGTTREYAEKELAERKWAADATLDYERKIAAKRAEVERKLQEETALQNANMKRTGFASIMLASNALGAGIPFPLARILSAQFPGLTNMISGFIGIAGAAVGLKVVVEIFDRITQKIEEAKRKEEDYQSAVQKTKMVIGEADAASQMRLYRAEAGLAAAQGDKLEAARFKGMAEAAEAVEQTAAAVNKLQEAELKEVRAAEARMQTWAAIGSLFHQLGNSPSALGVEKINDEMEKFGREFSLRSIEDEANNGHTAMDLLAESVNKAREQVDRLQKEHDAPQPFYYSGPGAAPPPAHHTTQQEVDAARQFLKLQQDIEEGEERRKAAADKEHERDLAEAAKQKGDQQARALKGELEAIDKLVNSLHNKADADRLAADATGKGSAASMQAAAAATVAKDTEDLLAAAKEKFKVGDITAKGFEQVKAAITAATPAIREYALAIEQAKAQGDLNRALADFNLKTRERIASLDAEAAGTGRVVKEQGKQAEVLMKIREQYEALYGKGAPAPGASPEQQATYAALQEDKGLLGTEQSKTQLVWYAAELKKVEAAAIEASDPSPWNRTEAKLAALQLEGSLTAQQMTELSAAMHFADASGALQKLVDKVADLRGAHAAMLSGSPYPALEAEAIKLASDYHLTVDEVRQQLIQAKQLEEANKAIEAVHALQPGGEGSRIADIERQVAAAKEMAAANKDNENVQMAVGLYLQQMTTEEDAILVKTGGVAAGFRAWLDELQAVESEAQTVKALLDQATKGLESTAGDAIVKIIETHKDQHQKLMHELRQMWENYFAGLAKMAIQHGLQKLLAPAAGEMGGLLGGILNPAQRKQRDLQKQFDEGPGKMFAGLVPKAGKDAALTANTFALQQLTEMLSMKTMGGGGGAGLLGMIPGGGGGGGGGWSGGGAAGASAGADVPFFAEGGDVSPGGSFISGEAGAERIDLERGGAHVTPLGGTVGGGDIHNHYDMRGAVVTDDLMRKADAAAMMQHTRAAAVAGAVSVSREASLRARPQR